MGHWASVEQFNVVASALLKNGKPITIQNVDHKLPLTALRGGDSRPRKHGVRALRGSGQLLFQVQCCL